jgi:hypothetical protein
MRVTYALLFDMVQTQGYRGDHEQTGASCAFVMLISSVSSRFVSAINEHQASVQDRQQLAVRWHIHAYRTIVSRLSVGEEKDSSFLKKERGNEIMI